MTGADYRVRAEHPRRPGTPLRVTDKAGRLIAVAGQTCESVSPEHLASMIRNDYVERIAPVPAKRVRRAVTPDGAED